MYILFYGTINFRSDTNLLLSLKLDFKKLRGDFYNKNYSALDQVVSNPAVLVAKLFYNCDSITSLVYLINLI